jgi:hypothetical protein
MRAPPLWVRPVSLISGAFFAACAVLLAWLIPPYQQFEILIVTFWFALLAALLFNNAGVFATPTGPHTGRIAAGVLMLAVGALWPFARSGDDADQRFYWMIALAPLALSGVLLLSPFRSAATPRPPPAQTGARRAPVSRVPESAGYRWLLPMALLMMALAIGVVLITVVLPALLVLLR